MQVHKLYVLLIVFLPFTVESQNCSGLPELLKFNTGNAVTTIKAWEKHKKELKKQFDEEMFGTQPPVPKGVRYKVVHETATAIGGKASRKRVNLYLNNLDHPLELLIYYPNGVKKAPAFLGYNFWGNHTVTFETDIPVTAQWSRNNNIIQDHKATDKMRGFSASRWPVEAIIDAGFALVTLYHGDVDPDFDDGFMNGVHGLYPREKYSWGTIAAWSWGLSYVMNYLEKDNRIDAKKVAVVGHSRLGKVALHAGATDERFALTISNNSGCGGAALSCRKKGETIKAINDRFPHWFTANFKKYNEKDDSMPFDQHQLIALVAPRPVYVASADLDAWADPEGEYLSAFLAGEVYRLYGLNGLKSDKMPAVHAPFHEGSVGYHIRAGKHDITLYDWQQYIAFATKRFCL